MRWSWVIVLAACRGPSEDPSTSDTPTDSLSSTDTDNDTGTPTDTTDSDTTDTDPTDTGTDPCAAKRAWGAFDAADEADLQAAMELALAETDAPGVALGLADPTGRRRWMSTAGWADRDAERDWLLDTPYPIGSVTKTYVSVRILQLMEAGTLTLDDPVEQWVSHPWSGEGVTLRHLLQHTSGIASYNYVGGFDGSRPWTPEGMVDWAHYVEPDLRFGPGTEHEYSNTNFVLLGLVVEEITGNPLADELQEQFFTPLCMTDTYLMEEHPADLVRGYGGDPELDITDDFHPTAGWAAGGVASTPADQLVWGSALFGGELVSPETLELMTTPLLIDGQEVGYGLGLFGGVDADYGGNWGHTGGYSGQLTYVFHLDSVDRVVVAMVNSFNVDLDRVANAAWLEVLGLSYDTL